MAIPTRGGRGKRTTKAVASFVVTFSAAQGVVGCNKQNVDPEPSGPSVYRGPGEAVCYRSVPEHCPKGASCNPPPPLQVDCPAELRDAGVEPATVTRRPPGKESWVRATPQFAFVNTTMGCIYTPEYFCTPAGSKRADCTPYPQTVTVKCTLDKDAGAQRYESFVYKDGLGQCREVPASECALTPRGRCTVADGDVVPCPAASPVAK